MKLRSGCLTSEPLYLLMGLGKACLTVLYEGAKPSVRVDAACRIPHAPVSKTAARSAAAGIERLNGCPGNIFWRLPEMILSPSLMPLVSVTGLPSVGLTSCWSTDCPCLGRRRQPAANSRLRRQAHAFICSRLAKARPARRRSEIHRQPDRSLDAIAAGEAGGGQRLAVQGAAGPAIGSAQAEFGAETLHGKRRVEA